MTAEFTKGPWRWYANRDSGRPTDVKIGASRHEFCWWMADTIREWLDTGEGPWETE